ncbi:DUF4383 domain-containing protein [Leptolyngbya sp. 7M]|uniref:DUF4383 domain-containing protein n=1 Tax=Leptolyngbya sp. 7M TaxID=2812896 RepID=UPI001B8C0E6E|nr:DUF4383 domain-containing protein [Leptolyngbya sp. 7M]QYO64221.1 DUF4383 domain-containing protein [Leptolyngbya sp. 7M]
MQTNTPLPSDQLSEQMQIRYCALLLGSSFLLLGLAGFLFSSGSDPANLVLAPGYGKALGVVPTNYLHNAVRILVGVWGIATFTSLSGSIIYNQMFAVMYTAIAVFGLLPVTNTIFGTMPIYGSNILISALTAGIAYYYGFVKAGNLNQGCGLST